MEESKTFEAEVHKLIEWLRQKRGPSLDLWRRAVLEDRRLTTSHSLAKKQFIDHIPQIIKSYEAKLLALVDDSNSQQKEAAQEETEHASASHGLHRWHQGYQLHELTREWGYLHQAFLKELELFDRDHPQVKVDVTLRARSILAELCFEGVTSSCLQYFHLHKQEADGMVTDLENAMEELQALEKQRAELWAEAAHDLRGSVSVVSSATSIIDREALPDVSKSKYFEVLQSSVTSLQSILMDVTDLARLEAGHEKRVIKTLEVLDCMREAESRFSVVAKERELFFNLEGPAELSVDGDKILLQRILATLLTNAFNYTKAGGITLQWGIDERTASNEHWYFQITDTGPGLMAGPGSPIVASLQHATEVSLEAQTGEHVRHHPAKLLPRKQHSSEGIGLSIVKRLCDLLDGSLELETVPGKSSRFRVVLPMKYETN